MDEFEVIPPIPLSRDRPPQATLYVDRVILPTLMTEESFIKHWKGVSVKKITSILK